MAESEAPLISPDVVRFRSLAYILGSVLCTWEQRAIWDGAAESGLVCDEGVWLSEPRAGLAPALKRRTFSLQLPCLLSITLDTTVLRYILRPFSSDNLQRTVFFHCGGDEVDGAVMVCTKLRVTKAVLNFVFIAAVHVFALLACRVLFCPVPPPFSRRNI
ncbi:hypothetical protein SRHO_G00217430 [Serrasalmus rhombeus]